MSRTNTIGAHKTVVFTEAGWTRVVYHTTCVVRWNHETIVLDSGGWQTATTKLRMNQAARQFGLGFSVYQSDYTWFVALDDGSTIPFVDGMEILRTPLDSIEIQDQQRQLAKFSPPDFPGEK